MFRRYKVHFSRPAAEAPGRAGRGRPERDANADRLKRFVAANGLAGELDRILPSAAFGILEVSCTPELAARLGEMPEVEVVLEG